MFIKSRSGMAAVIMLMTVMFIQAQEGHGNGRLKGTVVDEKGDSIEGATITLKYNEFNFQLQAKSNKKGQWGFIGLGKGTIMVTGELAGYVSATTQQPISGVAANPDILLVLSKAASTAGDENRDIILRASEMFDKRQYDEALKLYQEFAQKNPTYYKIGIYIANCKTEMRKYEEALAEFQKVLAQITKETPDLKGNAVASQVYAGIGDVYLRQDNYKAAEENFRLSIDINPGDPVLPYNIAEIMFVQNKIDDAEKYYQIAVQFKPEWPKPYLKLAYVSLNKGLMDKALEYLKKFCEIGKDDPKFAEGKALLDSLQKK